MARRSVITALGVGIAGLCLVAVEASAQIAGDSPAGGDGLKAFAQAQPPVRTRPRIRVTPRCRPQRETLDYPPPWDCNAPGPGYVRTCSSRLVQERRPSGTVIVPLMDCWWEPG